MAYQRAGADKILFGSDGPWLHPGVELEKIFALKMNTAELEKVLAGNFLKLTQRARNKIFEKRQPPQFNRSNENVNSEYRDPWLTHT